MTYSEIHFQETKRDFKEYLSHAHHKRFYFVGDDKSDEWLVFVNSLFKPLEIEVIELSALTEKEIENCSMIFLCLESKDILGSITLVKKSPYIPLLVFKNEKDNIFIDLCYEKGADIVLTKDAFYVKPTEINIKNSIEFILSLHCLLAKSYYLKWFWNVSNDIMNNLENSLPFKENRDILSQIRGKLNTAYGHLMKPNSEFHSNYDHTNEEFAFLSYWSCVNEIMKSDKINHSKYELSLPQNNKWKCIGEKEFTNNIPKYKLLCTLKRNDRLGIDELTESDSDKTVSDFYPKTFIPLFLGINNALDGVKSRLIKDLNKFRNNSSYIHGDELATEAYLNVMKYCSDMINLLHCLFHPNYRLLEVDRMEELSKYISYNYYLCEKMKGNCMRFLGKMIKVSPGGESEYPFIALEIDEFDIESDIKTKKEIHFSYKSTEKNRYEKLVGLTVEVFAVIDSKKPEKEGKYYQFLHAITILPVK